MIMSFLVSNLYLILFYYFCVGGFVGYCLFVCTLIFLFNSLLISCYFGVRIWHIFSPFQMAVQVFNQAVSI